MVEHHLRDFGGEVFDQLVDQLIFDIILGHMALAVLDVFLHVGFIGFECVEFADVLGKIIVQLGHLVLFDLMQLHLKNSVFAGKLFRLIILRELDVDFERVLGLVADDLILKARNELAGAERQAVIFALAAFKRFAVHKAFKIHHGDVVFFGCAVFHGDHTGIALLSACKLLFHFFIENGGGLFGCGKTLVFGNGNLRLHGCLHLEDKAVLAGADHLQRRAVNIDHVEAGFGDGTFHCFWIYGADGFFIKHIRAVHALHHGARSLALAEAGQGDLLVFMQIRLINCLFKRLTVQFDGEFMDIGFNLATFF